MEKNMANKSSPLVGTWKLLSWDLEFQDTGKRERYAGDNPKGYFMFGPEGRALALVTGSGRVSGQTAEQQAALFKSMLSYAGSYRVAGDELTISVDVSWNEAWNGTDQTRYFKIDGNRMEIVSAWQPHPTLPGGPMIRGLLSWERLE
jgi:hypothetical protein